MASDNQCRELHPDPRGRVDLLLLGCAQVATRRIEELLRQRVGVAVNLWEGADGVGEVVRDFCDASGLTGFQLTPRVIVEQVVRSAGARRFAARKAVA